MIKAIMRFKLLDNRNDNVPSEWIDCDEYDDFKEIGLVVEGKRTLDSHLPICSIGNIIEFNTQNGKYEIINILTQNGFLDIHIDVTCLKIK